MHCYIIFTYFILVILLLYPSNDYRVIICCIQRGITFFALIFLVFKIMLQKKMFKKEASTHYYSDINSNVSNRGCGFGSGLFGFCFNNNSQYNNCICVFCSIVVCLCKEQ